MRDIEKIESDLTHLKQVRFRNSIDMELFPENLKALKKEAKQVEKRIAKCEKEKQKVLLLNHSNPAC